MKKVFILLICIFLLTTLSGCYTSTFNPLGDEDEVIYESDDKTVRLEIAMKTDSVGRFYILQDEVMESFVIDYFIPREIIAVYIGAPELEESKLFLDVSFKKNNFFKQDYDIMYLSRRISEDDNLESETFTDFDVTLNRLYDEEVKPLNYFYNKWQTEDETIVFVNDDLTYYYGNMIQGALNGENIWISFQTNSFVVWSKVDLNMKLSGGVTFDGLNIVLEPFEWYTEYPSPITLIFMEIINA